MSNYINEEGIISEIVEKILKKKEENKHELTLQEARQQYRNQNKKCEYCKFCSEELDFEDCGGVIVDFDILWCMVKEEECDNKPCEFYQVKEW